MEKKYIEINPKYLEIDPMTKVKEDKMEYELIQHTCPNCHCDYQEYPLNVVYKRTTTVSFGYVNKGWIALEEHIDKDELFSINCGKCDVSLISYFAEEFKI